MKAWHVYHGDPSESSLLVFAENRNRARFVGFNNGPWEYDDYLGTCAKRAPIWDRYATKEAVIDCNQDLPLDAPPFYDDDYC